MAFVVTDACIACKYTDCVSVCPVDAFHEGKNFLVINPDECICCTLCVPECPIDAIFDEDDLAIDQQHFATLNRELSQRWQVINRQKPALVTAEHARHWHNKIALLEL